MITGQLRADFTSFFAAVTTAKTKLSDLEAGGSKVEDKLKRAADSFSGSRIIQQATLAVKAVTDIGGATTLTQKEQQRLNALVTEAIAKYDALGKQAPADMRRIAAETANAKSGVSSMGPALSSLAAGVGIGFSISTVTQFASKIFATAEQIKDMSDALGISTDAVQRFKYAAEQGGATIDDVGAAINKLNVQVGGNSKTTQAAAKELGLTVRELAALSPEDRFTAVAEALKGVANESRQADLATELLGRGWLKLAPMIKEGVTDLGNAASIMEKQTIEDLEGAKQAWENLANAVIIHSGNVLGAVTNTVKESTSSWKKFTMFADTAIKQGLGAAIAMTDLTAKAERAVAEVGKVKPPPPPAKPPGPTDDQIKKAEAYAKKLADIGAQLTGRGDVDNLTTTIAALHKEQQRGFTISRMSTEAATRLNDQVLTAIGVYTRAGKTIPEEWIRIARETTLASTKGVADISTLIHWVDNLKKTVLTIPAFPVPSLNLEGTLQTFGDALQIGEYVGLPKIPKGPSVLAQIFGTPEQLGSELSRTVIGALQGGGNPVTAAAGVGGLKIGEHFAKQWSKSLTDTGSGLFSKALGGVISSGLPLIGSFVAPLASKLWDGLFGTKGRDAVKEFAATFQQFDIDSMRFKPGGGFDELHAKLLAISDPAYGERLWRALTQGVGRNNPEQARAVIELINVALNEQKTALTEVADAAEETAIAETEAMTKAKSAVESMNSEIESLYKSIADEAPEENIGLVEQAARASIAALEGQRDKAQAELDEMIKTSTDQATAATDEVGKHLVENTDDWKTWAANVKAQLDDVAAKVRQLPVPAAPSAVPGFAGGTGGKYLDFGPGTLAMLHGRERISVQGEDGRGTGTVVAVVQIDGREVGRAAAKYVPSALAGAGL